MTILVTGAAGFIGSNLVKMIEEVKKRLQPRKKDKRVVIIVFLSVDGSGKQLPLLRWLFPGHISSSFG